MNDSKGPTRREDPAPGDDPARSLRELVARHAIDVRLAAHLSLLADAGVPIVVGGSAPLRFAIVEALAAASPVPSAAGRGAEIFVVANDGFSWLADPAAVGCLQPGAGSAPRSPRETRLRASGLADSLDATTTRCLVRALVRGFPLLADAADADLAALLARLRATPNRIPEADLARLGAVSFVHGDRVAAAHLLRPASSPDAAPQAPAVLGAIDVERGNWDDFAWAAIPELAARCGRSHAEYAARLDERIALLG